MTQEFIPLCKPMIGQEEKEAVADVLDSTWLSQGKIVEEFEKECARYLIARHAIAVSSCTAALHLCLLAEKQRRNFQEVAVSDLTVCTPNAIVHAGCTPVFVDVEMDSYLMSSPEGFYEVSVPVSLFGNPSVSHSRAGLVIADCAGAFGASHRLSPIAEFGDYCCFSFDPRKIITTGEGGLITTRKDEEAEWIRMVRSNGRDRDTHLTTEFRIVNYPVAGLNYRMTDIQAAIGLAQLKKIDFILKRRNEIAHLYNDLLANVPELKTPFVRQDCLHTFQTYAIQLTTDERISRDKFINFMLKNGVQCSYGSKAMHLEADFRHYPMDIYKTSYNSTMLMNKLVALPIYPEMTDEQVHHVCDLIHKG